MLNVRWTRKDQVRRYKCQTKARLKRITGETSVWPRLRTTTAAPTRQTLQRWGKWEAKAGRRDEVTTEETEGGKHVIFFR